MNQDVRLGRVDGVPVGANWSVLAIFVLIVWELADLVLPVYHPHQPPAVYWLVALVAAFLFFASLLAHEASHTVVAVHNGIRVRAITLWFFGGVSELESEALTRPSTSGSPSSAPPPASPWPRCSACSASGCTPRAAPWVWPAAPSAGSPGSTSCWASST